MKMIGRLFLPVFCFLQLSTQAQCTATTVPYYENFTSVTVSNQLPSCWSASSPGINCLSFSGANPYIAFRAATTGTTYFISAPFMGYPGSTYSANIVYFTSNITSPWLTFKMYRAPVQNTTAVQLISQRSAPYILSPAVPFGGLLSCPVAGAYVIILEAVSTSTNQNAVIYMDDFSITAPCGSMYTNDPYFGTGPSSFSVCVTNNIVQLNSNTVPGPFTYSWSTGASSQSILVTPTVSTVYSVAVTNSLYGCSGSKTYTVHVSPAPALTVTTSGNTVCYGSPITVTLAGASSYAGIPANPCTLYPGSTASMAVMGTFSSGCTSSAVISWTVLPQLNYTLSTQADTVCLDEVVTLSVNANYKYLWSTGNATATGNTFTFVPSASMNVIVEATDTNDCTSFNNVFIQVDNCTALQDHDKSDPMVFPNPAHDRMLLNEEHLMSWTIFDTHGLMVLEGKNREIDLTGLRAGLYLIRYTHNSQESHTRFLKE